jgi:hypothetical protein
MKAEKKTTKVETTTTRTLRKTDTGRPPRYYLF